MTIKTRSILLAAVLATPLAMVATPAHAQYRVENGAALDANNRIGSNGSNGGGRTYQFNQGDAIVTGNVTAGREFRGNTTTTDPRAFRANTAGGNMDRFTRQSSSAYENNAQNVRRYYGTSEGTAPPQGFGQQQIGSSGFVQTPPPTRSPGDLRIGDVYNNDAMGFSAAPRPGELMMPGPVDNSNSQSLLRASPLYGVVQENQNTDPLQPGFKNFRRQPRGLSDQQVDAARREMGDSRTPRSEEDLNQQPISEQDIGARAAIDKPYESPLSQPLSGPTLENGNLANERLQGQVRPEQSVRNELVPAPEQSTQYKELRSRFKNLKPGTVTDQQANQQFQNELRQRDEQAKKNPKTGAGTGSGTSSVRRTPGSMGGGGGPVVIPGNGGGMPSSPTPTPAPSTETPPVAIAPTPNVEAPRTPDTPKVPAVAVKPGNEEAPDLNTESIKPGQSLKVDTLTAGMKAGRVKDTLARAEELLREQKYTGAIEQYDFAERVVPNNPLITLGRANAELGASYYARAENNIRRALNADNALLMAQFNMEKFLGKERLSFLEKDLKQVTSEETAQARAPFLLAYLKYHTGDKKMAANYLALSEKRLGKEDELYKLMRLHWDLPKADPIPDDLNK